MKGKEYLLVLIFVSSMLLNGCSIIGLTAGIAGSGNEKLFNRESQTLSTIDSNKTITVITNENETIKGNFIGITRIPFAEYSAKYEEAMNQLSDSVNLLKLGEVITFTRKIDYVSGQQGTGKQSTGKILKKTTEKFFGFGFGGIIIGYSTYEDAILFPLSSIYDLSNQNDEQIDLKKIISLMNKEKIPLASYLTIRKQEKNLSIQWKDIKEIEIETFGGWWLIGLLTGVAVDAVIRSSIEIDVNIGRL